MKADTT